MRVRWPLNSLEIVGFLSLIQSNTLSQDAQVSDRKQYFSYWSVIKVLIQNWLGLVCENGGFLLQKYAFLS